MSLPLRLWGTRYWYGSAFELEALLLKKTTNNNPAKAGMF
jgi:hypothetical protein